MLSCRLLESSENPNQFHRSSPPLETITVSDFTWDVFLSHSSHDKPRVARLAKRLTDEGFQVWFDAEAIAGGGDIVAAIEHGLEHSRVLILCMTEAAFQSEWVRLERNTAIFRDPSNHERRFLPLKFEDGPIPAMLRRLKYIDWRAEADEAWQELLALLQPGAAHPPEMPADQWNPFDPYIPAIGGSFVGRRNELRRLLTAMETAHSVSVVGDWRTGKTSLLAAFAERARVAGREVRQLNGEGPEGGSLEFFVTQVTGRATPAETEAAASQLSEWAIAHRRDGMRPVLIVDEVEPLIESFGPRFFERLRGMLSSLMVVLCSRQELDRVYASHSRTSPFHNTLEQVRVALLSSREVEDLLKPAEGILTQEDLSRIREWAGLHPYFIQLLGHELADARLNGLPIEHAMDRFYETSASRFRELWQVLSDTDRTELRKLVSDVPVERRPLRSRGLVTPDGKAFGRILREWLQEEQP